MDPYRARELLDGVREEIGARTEEQVSGLDVIAYRVVTVYRELLDLLLADGGCLDGLRFRWSDWSGKMSQLLGKRIMAKRRCVSCAQPVAASGRTRMRRTGILVPPVGHAHDLEIVVGLGELVAVVSSVLHEGSFNRLGPAA